LYDKEVRDFLLGKFRTSEMQFGDLLAQWWRIWLLYYVAVLGGGALPLWLRRGVTAVYNIGLPVFAGTLGQCLARWGGDGDRLGNRVFIGFRSPLGAPRPAKLPPGYEANIVAAPFPREAEKALPAAVRQEQEAIVDVEPFAATRHLTLTWRSATGQIRE